MAEDDAGKRGTQLLEEAVLNSLFHLGAGGHGVGLAAISKHAGIHRERGSANMLNDAITTGVAGSLLDQGKVERRPQTNGRAGWALTEIERQRRSRPEQLPAPLRFTFKGTILSLAEQRPEVEPVDENAVGAARQSLIQSGSAIEDGLVGTNYDPRLHATVAAINGKLVANDSIIFVGLLTEHLESLASAFSEELEAGLEASLRAQTTNLRMFVAQYEEWHRFVGAARRAELEELEPGEIVAAAERAADELAAHPELAAPEPPAFIRYLIEAATRPGLSAKRALFGLGRSLQNLVIGIANWGAEFAKETAGVVRTEGAKWAGRAILLGLAVSVGGTMLTSMGASSGVAQAVSEAIKLLKEMKP
jgi:hypothetical protein